MGRDRTARKLALILGAAVLCGWGVAAPIGSLHGGVYRGPGSTVPPGGAPSGPATPGGSGTGGGPTSDEASWTMWWAYRRDPFLDLKSAVQSGGVTTSGSDFPLGRGERDQDRRPLRPDELVVREQVVPALMAALESEGSIDLQSGCLMALAKIGMSPPGHSLNEVLSSRLGAANQELAETAAVALGISGEEGALFVLAELLEDTESARKRLGGKEVPVRTRAFAAYGLGLGAAQSAREDVRRFAVSHLAGALRRERYAARDVPVAIVQAIGLVPLAHVDESPAAAETQPPSVSRAAQVRFLLSVLSDGAIDEGVRAHVPGTVGVLLEDCELANPGSALKQAAVSALLALLDPHAKASVELRQGAVIGLQLLSDGDGDAIDREVRAELTRVSVDGDVLSQGLAAIALGEVAARAGSGPEPGEGLAGARKHLLARLVGGTSLTRPWAALALALCERRRAAHGEEPSSAVTTALRYALESANSPEERAGMALALGLTRDPAGVEPVLELFTDSSSDDVRGHYAIALGLFGSPTASAVLKETVQRSRFRPGLLRDAAIGLALVGDKTAVPMLAEELALASSLASQAALTSALGMIGDTRSVEPLLKLLVDTSKTTRARAFAAAALGNLADRQPFPFQTGITRRVLWRSAPETLSDPGTGRGLLDLF